MRALIILLALAGPAFAQGPGDGDLVRGSTRCAGKASWNREGSKTLRIESGYLCPITLEQCLHEATIEVQGQEHVVLGCGTTRASGSWYVDFEP